MATNVETMWVTDQDQLQRTVQTLVSQGGVVQGQSDTEVTIFLKKKMNVIVLVVGLILCLVPGLAYLIWYSTADQSQQISVRIGTPVTGKTDHQHWYDGQQDPGAGTVPTGDPNAAPTTPAPGPGSTAPAPLPTNDVPPPGYDAVPPPAQPIAGGAPVPPPPPPSATQPPPAPPTAPPGPTGIGGPGI